MEKAFPWLNMRDMRGGESSICSSAEGTEDQWPICPSRPIHLLVQDLMETMESMKKAVRVLESEATFSRSGLMIFDYDVGEHRDCTFLRLWS